MKRSVGALALCVLLQIAGRASQAPPSSGISRNDREVVLTMLRQIKDDVQKHYYDPTLHGIDLQANFAETESQIKAATDINQVIALLVEPVWKLDDSHTTFFPPNRAMLVDYGWEMGMVGNVPLVLRVDAASDAAVKGLSPGDQVLTLNRFQPDRANLWRISYFYRYIRPQAQQHIVVRKPDGAERTLDVKSRVVKKPPTELDDLIEEMSAVNKHDVVLAIEKRRDRETQEHVKPTKNPFTGSLIVLVDSRSASAAEMFARIVQLEKRGTVMGDRTAGAVMESQFFAHSVGLGAVAFYATSVTVADIRMADGMSLEKAGVVPDQAILPTAADLAARRDPVLARALALAGTEMTPEKAAALFDEKR